jgi:hypothetical protein
MTTAGDPPDAARAQRETICDAIRTRRLLMFAYGGLVRVVEPHIFGVNTAGHEALSAWLRPGYSRTDPAGGWRMYRADGISALQRLDEPFAGPRPGYNPGDPHLETVYCSLPLIGGAEG